MMFANAVLRQRPVHRRAERDGQRTQGASCERVVRVQNLAAPRLGQRTRRVADQFVRAALEQHIGRTFREDQNAPGRFGVRVDGAHDLAFGGKRDLSNPVEAMFQTLRFDARLSRRDDERPLGRIALDRPASVALLQHGVVGPIGDCERALQFRPEDRP